MLYGIECWAIKKQHISKMSVAEMRMLRWMCGKTRKDRIRNEHIREMVRVAPIEDKLRENRLRWFGLVQCTPIDAPMQKSDSIEGAGNVMGRGRSRLSWESVVKHDMSIFNLTELRALDHVDWRKRIHIADPN